MLALSLVYGAGDGLFDISSRLFSSGYSLLGSPFDISHSLFSGSPCLSSRLFSSGYCPLGSLFDVSHSLFSGSPCLSSRLFSSGYCPLGSLFDLILADTAGAVPKPSCIWTWPFHWRKDVKRIPEEKGGPQRGRRRDPTRGRKTPDGHLPSGPRPLESFFCSLRRLHPLGDPHRLLGALRFAHSIDVPVAEVDDDLSHLQGEGDL